MLQTEHCQIKLHTAPASNNRSKYIYHTGLTTKNATLETWMRLHFMLLFKHAHLHSNTVFKIQDTNFTFDFIIYNPIFKRGKLIFLIV